VRDILRRLRIDGYCHRERLAPFRREGFEVANFEIYAYRAGRNAQQAVVEVEERLFRGHPDVVDADLADYFGSLPHADLLKSVAGNWRVEGEDDDGGARDRAFQYAASLVVAFFAYGISRSIAHRSPGAPQCRRTVADNDSAAAVSPR
jgi:hypothetical protein